MALAGSMHAVSHPRTSQSHSQIANVREILKDPGRHRARSEPPQVPMTNGATGQQISIRAWSTTRPPHNIDVTRGDSWKHNPNIFMANEKPASKMFLIPESGHKVITVYCGRATLDIINRFHILLVDP